ncbi:MAG: DnaJ domain-containing protein [Azospirillaceae bacterium]|nr:DnaJ domain-containing protein [Azospirillaceae bacterium]
MAVENPYGILGVAQDASADDIRKSYHKLAKRYHPDLNPGKPEAEQKFKSVTAAYELLSDPAKRTRFDRGEIDANGSETAAAPPAGDPRWRQAAGAGGTVHNIDIGDLFGDLFGGGGRGAGAPAGVRYSLEVDFLDAVNGGKRRITLPDGKTIDLAIPVGTEDGQVLRLNGKPPLTIELTVRPHPWFTRVGNDIHVEVPVTVAEAGLGGKIKVPTVTRPVMVTVPPGSDSGSVLRLRGKGVRHGGQAGDQIVTLRIVLGGPPDPALSAALREWAGRNPTDPRQSMLG